MSNAVREAMIESYALMILVMSAFFVYFCGMVWAFCNPKLSGTEEEITSVCESDILRSSDVSMEQLLEPPVEVERTRDWATTIRTNYNNRRSDVVKVTVSSVYITQVLPGKVSSPQ